MIFFQTNSIMFLALLMLFHWFEAKDFSLEIKKKDVMMHKILGMHFGEIIHNRVGGWEVQKNRNM